MLPSISLRKVEGTSMSVIRLIPYWLPKRYIYAVLNKKKLVSPALRLC